jgi:hypothetical protein
VHWLGSHPEIKAFNFEIKSLQHNHPGHIVKRVYKGLPEGPYLRGYKSPNDIEDLRAINKLHDYFPKTKLIIGLRHPIKWLESLYNYRIQNGMDIAPLEGLNEICFAGQSGVCIDRSNFHLNLAKMGKTNLTDDEFHYFNEPQTKGLKELNPRKTASKVFLYDTDQLGDRNQTRSHQFRETIQNYLGLIEQPPPMAHYSPGKKNLNITEQKRRGAKKINICDPKYLKQRQKLSMQGNRVGTWVRKYFLMSPDVVVANPQHFHSILASYARDPCLINGTRVF